MKKVGCSVALATGENLLFFGLAFPEEDDAENLALASSAVVVAVVDYIVFAVAVAVAAAVVAVIAAAVA